MSGRTIRTENNWVQEIRVVDIYYWVLQKETLLKMTVDTLFTNLKWDHSPKEPGVTLWPNIVFYTLGWVGRPPRSFSSIRFYPHCFIPLGLVKVSSSHLWILHTHSNIYSLLWSLVLVSFSWFPWHNIWERGKTFLYHSIENIYKVNYLIICVASLCSLSTICLENWSTVRTLDQEKHEDPETTKLYLVKWRGLV